MFLVPHIPPSLNRWYTYAIKSHKDLLITEAFRPTGIPLGQPELHFCCWIVCPLEVHPGGHFITCRLMRNIDPTLASGTQQYTVSKVDRGIEFKHISLMKNIYYFKCISCDMSVRP